MNVSKLLFYLLVAVLSIGVLQGLTIGGLFFFKQSGEKRANYFYGLLLITFALTMLHHIFVMTGFFERFPSLYFLPIYYTLAFPTLLFYYVKLSLYPGYQFQATDIKHFILPIGQFLFFTSIFFTTVAYKSHLGRHFFNPFYGALEQLLYLTTFFAYLFFASRYIQRKRQSIRERKELRQVLYMKVLVKILFLLFCVQTAFVLSDFITFELFDINLRSVRLYAAAGVLSFAALLFWLGTYGFQVLFWGRKVFGKLRN